MAEVVAIQEVELEAATLAVVDSEGAMLSVEAATAAVDAVVVAVEAA